MNEIEADDLVAGRYRLAADESAPPPALMPYQAAWVADDAQLKIAEKGRRIGLTWADGPYVVPDPTPGAFWLRGTVRDGAGARCRGGACR